MVQVVCTIFLMLAYFINCFTRFDVEKESRSNSKAGHFDNIDAAVINSGGFCTALFTLLIMTDESMLSKRPVLTVSAIFVTYLFYP